MIKFLLLILFSSIIFNEDIDKGKIDQKVFDNDWKTNVLALGNGMIPLGQFENNKPFKAISLMAMKYYWLNEYKNTKNNEDVSDRNRSFWWLFFLNFYSIIDSYVDDQLKKFPDDSTLEYNKESK